MELALLQLPLSAKLSDRSATPGCFPNRCLPVPLFVLGPLLPVHQDLPGHCPTRTSGRCRHHEGVCCLDLNLRKIGSPDACNKSFDRVSLVILPLDEKHRDENRAAKSQLDRKHLTASVSIHGGFRQVFQASLIAPSVRPSTCTRSSNGVNSPDAPTRRRLYTLAFRVTYPP